MSAITENIRPEEKRTMVKVLAKALTVSEPGAPCQLEVMASVSSGLSVTSLYAKPGADDGAGKTKGARTTVDPIDFAAMDVVDEMDRMGVEWASQLDCGSLGRTSLNLAAWAGYVVDAGSVEELDQTIELMSRWAVSIEKAHGVKGAQGWGHACPACGETYAEGEEWAQWAPIFGGKAVRVGEWFVWCSHCSYVMSKPQARVRASRALAKLAGSSRLSRMWQKEVKEARRTVTSSNKLASEAEDAGSWASASRHYAKAESGVRRTVALIDDLHAGTYLRMHGTLAEKAAAA